MAAFMLKSLVLRGVSVLRDEVAVGLRLGTSAKASLHAPGIRNSNRHPAPGCDKPDGQPGSGPDVDYSTKGITPGAGRSRSLGCRVLPDAARTTPPGLTSAVAANIRAIPACFAALASEDSLRILVARQSEALPAEHESAREVLEDLPVKPSWRKPAGRTPPVGMRANEGR
jgi:hypothetical protein